MATTVTTPVPVTEYAGGTVAREQVGLWQAGGRRLRRNKLALAAVVYLALLVLVAIVSFFWTPYKPNFIGACETYQTPSPAHLFGCDELGRDSLSRPIAGHDGS